MSKKEIQEIVDAAVEKAVKQTMLLTIAHCRDEVKNLHKQIETRLYAYPELIKNIEKYEADIEDLRREAPGRSKDIVFYSTAGGGSRLSNEEIQEARIEIVRRKIYRDEAEIKEIEFALAAVQNDFYFKVIEMKFFQCMSDEEIGQEMNCDPSTVRRNKNRLIKRIAVKLYGAQAVS